MTGRRSARLPAALGLFVLLALTTAAGRASASTDVKYSHPAAAVSIARSAAARESQLVAGEDRRLQDIRTISTLARWQKRAQHAPYRAGTPYGYTLVLTQRSQPYTLADLIRLEPQTLLRLSDGSYLLKEHIVVLQGAELDLTTPGLVFRIASGPDGFSSIVSYGGRLKLIGAPQRPLQITSWDLAAGRVDTVTSDGRAYLRAIGGQVQMSYVNLSDLGFWSGRTGGLALTGTDRPNTGSLDVKSAGSNGSVGGLQVLPAGPLPAGAPNPDDNGIYMNTFVAARIDHVIATGDAIGFFASGADGLVLADSQFLDSQITGVDLHRFVTSTSISRTVSNGSGGLGFNLGRATEGVQLTQCTAKGNAGDGFALSGAPLADGPSAVGSPITRYGNNLLSNSTSANNGHYGIDVQNGFNITVSGNRVVAGQMGIVATDGASGVSLNANHVRGTAKYGIALLDGVRQSSLTGNVVTDARIYLRDSQATIQGNTVVGALGHGISVVGAASGTSVVNNVVTGSGTSAIDTARAGDGVAVHSNVDAQWHDTTSLFVTYWHLLLHPMSLLWAAILALVLVSMITGLRRGPIVRGTNPYGRPGTHLMYTRRA